MIDPGSDNNMIFQTNKFMEDIGKFFMNNSQSRNIFDIIKEELPNKDLEEENDKKSEEEIDEKKIPEILKLFTTIDFPYTEQNKLLYLSLLIHALVN